MVVGGSTVRLLTDIISVSCYFSQHQKRTLPDARKTPTSSGELKEMYELFYKFET